MKKLALELDELQVETFTTSAEQQPAKGTVQGHYGTNHTNQYTCTTTPYYTHCGDMHCY